MDRDRADVAEVSTLYRGYNLILLVTSTAASLKYAGDSELLFSETFSTSPVHCLYTLCFKMSTIVPIVIN